ncbi:MAG TPA: type II secretion system protein [Alphaproteobacteria bacterium]|nr:type II secretion system protein [Alphaproteobacteria bacterium]
MSGAAQKRRGFTMVEIAIVLGVVGLIIGAIFTASSHVRYKMQVNDASNELSQISINIRNYYSGRQTSYAALNGARALNATPSAADFTYYTGLFNAATANIFPSEMIAGGFVNNQWSQVAANTAQAALAGSAGNPVQYVIEYNNLAQGPCTDLVVGNSLADRTTALVKVVVTGSAATTFSGTSLPVSPIPAGTACNAASTNIVDWYYSLDN